MSWVYENYPRSAGVEAKIKGNYTTPHQDVALGKVSSGRYTFKIPDLGGRSPFDFFFLKDADALVATCDGRVCKVENRNTGETFTINI